MEETAGLKALDEVAQYLECAEFNNASTNGEFGLGFQRRARASTISYSSSSYNDMKKPLDSLHQYLEDVGDDELEVANFLSSMSSERRLESWTANSGESDPMFLIRTVEKIDPNNPIGGTLTNRNRPRSYSASEVSFYKHPSLESNDKAQLGSYTPEERRKRIERFLEKRKLRVWTKRVKYDVRKNLADSRVRVRGRFVKKEELSSAVGDIIMENT